MNLDLKNAYVLSEQLVRERRPISPQLLKDLNAAVMKNTGSMYNTPLGSFDSSKGGLEK